VFYYSATREGEHAERQLQRYTGIVQADAYSGFNGLFVPGRQPGPIVEVACWAHSPKMTANSSLRCCNNAAPMLRLGLRFLITRHAQGPSGEAQGRTSLLNRNSRNREP
jgi:hypothetical protein